MLHRYPHRFSFIRTYIIIWKIKEIQKIMYGSYVIEINLFSSSVLKDGCYIHGFQTVYVAMAQDLL